MKKTLLYLIIGAAALTFVACEKKVEVTKEDTKTEETKAAEKPATENAAAKPAEEAMKDGEKVEVNKADAPNSQPAAPQDNMPKMQNEPVTAPAEQK